MEAHFEHLDRTFCADLTHPIDISLPLASTGKAAPSAWYVEPLSIEPVRLDGFVGDVNEGSSVNFRNIFFNPHGHGTHTECVGHISKEWHSINQSLKTFFFYAQLVTVQPKEINGDQVITLDLIEPLVKQQPQAIVIRTLPNTDEKQTLNYSNTNPTYIDEAVALWLREQGVEHLLIDLPSVDKEKDDGALKAHKAFWNYPKAPRLNATITEFIYVPNAIEDGHYLLNLQIASFENDASPSKPILYPLLSNI